MSKTRSSHEQKTLGDRQRYINNSVRLKVPSPTVDEPLLDVDSTETIPEPDKEYNRVSTSKKPPSPAAQFIREKWPEILIALVLLPVFGFLAYQAFTLNREVGELRMELNAERLQHQQLEQQLEKTETRLQAEVDKLGDRIDRADKRLTK